MPNRHRGEIEAELGGTKRTLVLTLGALAERETVFAAEDINGLAERFGTGRLAANDIGRLIGAGLRGAGNDIDDETVMAMHHEDGIAGLAGIAVELLGATFGKAGNPAED